MKKLDRHLIVSFFGPFFAILFVVTFALSLQFLWRYIDELVGKGLGLGVIMEFLGWGACTLLPLSMPLASLLASIMTMGGLGEHNELLAMKSAGISLQRILAPVIILSVLISIGAFFVSNNLVPLSYNKIYTLREDIARTKNEIKIPVGTFYDGIEGYNLRIGSQDDGTGMMRDIIIYNHTSSGGNVSMTVADSGSISISPDKKRLIFDLYSGCSYDEKNSMTYRDTSLSLNRASFDRQNLIISLENYGFSRSEKDRYGDEVMSKGLRTLQQDRDSLSRVYDTLVNLQVHRFLTMSGLTYGHQLDTVGKKGVTLPRNMKIDTLFKITDRQQLTSATGNALSKLDRVKESVENYGREGERYYEPLRRIDIESYRKFTLSLACLLFFFVGAPLGAIIRKGGLGTPVIISIFFFVVYYIIDTIGKRLARNGSITPFEGTIVSTLVLLPIGIFLMRKSTQDSALFNLDSYREFFRYWWRKVTKIYHRFLNMFSKAGSRIRIVYMGTPEFAVAPLDALMQSEFEVVGVVTSVDKPSGRGLNVTQSAVKRYAVEHNLPCLQPEKLKDPEFLEQLKALKANLFVVVAFRMLPKEVWSMPALGTFNLHASLLPQYRGAAPINWVIINGEKFTGVTTFMLDEQIDTGKVLFQESCNIEDYDDVGTLHDKLMKMGSALVVKTVDAIENRSVKPKEQVMPFNKALRTAPKLSRETGHIDWSASARVVSLLIRGLSPYPAAYSTLVKEESVLNVKIYEAYPVQNKDFSIPAGTIATDGKSFLEVKCGNGALRITSLQVAGKKRMDIGAFLLGFRDAASWRFE